MRRIGSGLALASKRGVRQKAFLRAPFLDRPFFTDGLLKGEEDSRATPGRTFGPNFGTVLLDNRF